MKLRFLLLSISFAIGSLSYAQCTGCTTTISSASATPMVVGAGDTVCVTSTGSLSGLILVNGGRLCNEGSITSASIALTGGSIFNAGTMSNQELGITDGTFTNQGTANIDSIAIEGSSITFMNMGTVNSIGISQNATGTGAIPAMHNMGSGNITCDSILVAGGEVHNHGSFTVNYSIANYSPAVFENHCNMSIGQHFGNTGSFKTEKMIPVGGDFGNSGTITGPTIGCGGFDVTGDSGNSGDFGADGSNIDICDNGSGFDANTGTLGASVTNCVCADMCGVGIDELAPMSFDVYPNPAIDRINILVSNIYPESKFVVYDVQGKTLVKGNITATQFEISTDFEAGVYYVSVYSKEHIPATTSFVVK